MTEWSIHEVAQRSGVTTRTLRHYDAIGILSPTRTG
ncbi:MAG TPA: MerR family transcriptional regulator, partial [Microbacterium sp.]|nr:MerR family transcriptional regulator [Microbacterium sp.]